MSAGVLKGVRILEIAGIGPGPFCAMLLADLGAEVISIERPAAAARNRATQITQRGKKSVVLDLKQPEAVDAVLRLAGNADALIEGMRPGVAERLGIGPDACLARNPALVYGRMTGWGQQGPLAQAAGHDSNYTALAGALWFASPPGQPPVAPSTLLGDVGGGALYLALGIVAGVLRARTDGRGQVVDAAIVDGAAHMMNLLLGMIAARGTGFERGAGFEASHWAARSYRCADGQWINLASLEPQFYAELVRRFGLADDPAFAAGHMDREAWPGLTERLAVLFAGHDRAHWCAILEGSDACFAPVLSPPQAAQHPHMMARGVYSTIDGVLQANPAPRFSATPSRPLRSISARGAHTREVLAEAGLDPGAIDRLAARAGA
ncbi:MAG: CoA transferase [Burkholderiaceae bacterium]|nr:CoA transferase [Burkholderiaceae bacterium]